MRDHGSQRHFKRLRNRVRELEQEVAALRAPNLFWHRDENPGGSLYEVMEGCPVATICEMDAAATRGSYFAFRTHTGKCEAHPTRASAEAAMDLYLKDLKKLRSEEDGRS